MSYLTRFGVGLLAASMEEEEVLQEAEVVEMDDSDNVEASLIESADAAGEVAATQDAIEEGAEAADTLDEVADTLEETEQEGGADPVTAKVAEVAIEAIYARLNIPRKSTVSVEDFADATGRIRATRISVEEVRETVRKIWEGIKALFKRVVEWVQTALTKLFDSAEKVKARAEKIKKAAEGATGKPKDEKIKGSFLGVLRSDNYSDKAGFLKMVDGGKIVSGGLAEVLKVAGAVAATDPAKLIADKGAFDAFDTGKVLASTIGANVPAGSWFKAVADRVYKARGLEVRYFGPDVATGNLGFGLVIPASEATGAEGMAALSKVKVISAPYDQTKAKDAEVTPLTADEAGKVADAVIAGANSMVAVRKAAEDTAKQFNDLVKISIGNVAEEDKEAAERARSVARLQSGASSILSGITGVAVRNAVTVLNASLTYAELSLRNLSTEEAEEEEVPAGEPSGDEEVQAEAGEAGEGTAEEVVEKAEEVAEQAAEVAEKAEEVAEAAAAVATESVKPSFLKSRKVVKR